jgi:protoporphyrinogen/coproporphyrinogen III oxidase
MPAESRDVIVIGGGISGLSCAFRLKRAGLSVALLESEPQPGGLIGSVHRDGCLFDSGPQSFQGTEAILGLVQELGLASELREAPPRAPRYVLRRGKLQKIPLSPPALLTSSLLGIGTKLTIASDLAGRSKPPTEEESVAAFVRRKFGHEILEYLVTPFVSGVYAGDPEKLSLRAAFPTLEEWEREHGSILRGAMKSRSRGGERRGPPALCSFRGGMAALTEGLAVALGADARLGERATAVHRTGESYSVHTQGATGESEFHARCVVFAVPAYAVAKLAEPFAAPMAKLLSGIPYAPVVVMSHAYYTKQIGAVLDGFGVLIPRAEKHRTLGIVWNTSLFAGRAPEGQAVLTSFLGGATDEEVIQKSDDEIAAIAVHDAAQILQITGSPITTAIWRHPKALPQYNLGHGHIVDAVGEEQQKTPGLLLCGNYLHGPAIGKCVEKAFETAESASAYLKG